MKILKGKIFRNLAKDSSSQPMLSAEQILSFHQNGFLILEKFLNPLIVERLVRRYEPIFGGEFDTQVYPDEWYGRTGMCIPNMTKEICNGWKCDRTVASVVLSSQIHAIAAQLHGWGSSRIAQDDVISKPHSGGTAVQYHRDATYISDQFSPQQDNSITVWLPLDDVTLESGTIEYLSESHRWDIDPSKALSSFHSANADTCPRSNFLCSLRSSIGSQLDEEPSFQFVEIPRGGVVFHHQNTFHGSGVNHTAAQMRRALVIHTLRGNTTFSPTRSSSYIYGRYQLKERPQELNESFFPVCWSSGGKAPNRRSKWLDSYCEDLSAEELLSL